jgi:hypothetical protein
VEVKALLPVIWRLQQRNLLVIGIVFLVRKRRNKMSSGRDEMMERWSQEIKVVEKHIRETQPVEDPYQKRTLMRMIDYRQTLITEIARLDKLIKELQDA